MVTLRRHPKNRGLLRPRVEILGAFGSGKTTLAHTISGEGRTLLLERHEHNTFWGSPVANQVTGFLAYDLSFLLQHQYLAATAAQVSHDGVAICDWSFVSDELWASMRLDEGDLAAYRAVHRRFQEAVGGSIGYIYLRTNESTLLERLRARNRIGESFSLVEIRDATHQLDALVQSLPNDRLLILDDDTDSNKTRALVSQWLGDECGG